MVCNRWRYGKLQKRPKSVKHAMRNTFTSFRLSILLFFSLSLQIDNLDCTVSLVDFNRFFVFEEIFGGREHAWNQSGDKRVP